jgi:hypothetical protein
MAYLSFPGIYGCLNNIQDTSPNLPSPKFALSSLFLPPLRPATTVSIQQ